MFQKTKEFNDASQESKEYIKAVENNNISEAKACLDKGADIHQVGGAYNALEVAATKGFSDMIKFLREYRDKEGKHPLKIDRSYYFTTPLDTVCSQYVSKPSNINKDVLAALLGGGASLDVSPRNHGRLSITYFSSSYNS